MAFDGFVVAALADELNKTLCGGRIYKITQPEKDEIILTIRRDSDVKYLLISANPSLPIVYLTDEKKQGPPTAPNFCMLLRKYIQNARISGVTQPENERILMLSLSYRDELGDLKDCSLIAELMGKHSNIILTDAKGNIIDSIKRIPLHVSSVREVLPGKPYFIPKTVEKQNPLTVAREDFDRILTANPRALDQALYQSFTGVSPLEAAVFLEGTGIDADVPFTQLNETEKAHLYASFTRLMQAVRQGEFHPCIVYENGVPDIFSAFDTIRRGRKASECFDSISAMLIRYYGEKEAAGRIRQRSADLRRVVQTLYERSLKKYDLQQKQMRDTAKMEQYRIYGEMINTYGYGVTQGEKSFVCTNYYDGKEIRVPLNPEIPVMENAKVYFARYAKLKRTKEALDQLLKETSDALHYLDSISSALDIAADEADLRQIREELYLSGYLRQRGPAKKQKIHNRPMHYVSSDGYDIYVGKNNIQNEELTHKLADGADWWFHAKGIAGSHVILKSGKEMPPDKSFEEAAALAAHFSKAGKAGHAEVDYVQKKHLKKTPKAPIGFVIYHTNYSMLASTDISGIRRLQE